MRQRIDERRERRGTVSLEAMGLDMAQQLEWTRLRTQEESLGRSPETATLRAWELFRARYERVDSVDPRKGWREKGVPRATERVYVEVDLSGVLTYLSRQERRQTGPVTAGWLDRLLEVATKRAPVEVQSLQFSRTKFHSAREAARWAVNHGFRAEKVEETKGGWRIAQADATLFDEDCFGEGEKFRERELDSAAGVKIVYGRRRRTEQLENASFTIPNTTPPGLVFGMTELGGADADHQHQHRYVYDPQTGSGITDSGEIPESHFHLIVAGKVQESGMGPGLQFFPSVSPGGEVGPSWWSGGHSHEIKDGAVTGGSPAVLSTDRSAGQPPYVRQESLDDQVARVTRAVLEGGL